MRVSDLMANLTAKSVFPAFLLMFSMVFLLVFSAAPAGAQSRTPPMPPPLQTLADEGAQVRYLGRSYGLDGWITIKNGQEQYFYVTGDGQAMVMGLLFDKSGKLVTVEQVRELQQKSGDVLDFFASDTPQNAMPSVTADKQQAAFKTPAEQLFDDVENSNWIPLGVAGAPAIYIFVDPQCPYCRAFVNDLRRNYIENGMVQVRMIPVGFRDETRAQAAFLLAVPNPKARWYRHLDGDKDALPVTPGINEQGVQRNLKIMQSWDLNVTPLTLYRDKNGGIKIIQGRAGRLADLFADLPAASLPATDLSVSSPAGE